MSEIKRQCEMAEKRPFYLHYDVKTSTDRSQTITYKANGMLDCIGEIARRIYDQTYPLLERYLNYFDDRSFVLQFLLWLEYLSVERKLSWFIITE